MASRLSRPATKSRFMASKIDCTGNSNLLKDVLAHPIIPQSNEAGFKDQLKKDLPSSQLRFRTQQQLLRAPMRESTT